MNLLLPQHQDEARKMTDAPERIWTCNETRDIYITEAQDDTTEYVRADILADWQASQAYRYIGKDGKSVLARDLEDERDALRLEVARLKMQAAMMDAWVAGEPSQPPHAGRDKTGVAP